MRNYIALHISFALSLAACGGGSEEPSTVELGFYRDGTYVPLSAGGTCYVADAPQGGYWSMPTVRTTGMADQATVSCTLLDDALGMLGEEETFRVFSASDAHLEIEQFLLPLLAVDQPTFSELDGHTGSLHCDVTDDDGVEASAGFDVVLATEVVR